MTQESSPANSPIEVTLSAQHWQSGPNAADGNTSAVGDDITLHIDVRNVTRAAFDIDGRLAVGDGLDLVVRGPDGQARPLTRREKPGRDRISLAPGATFSTYLELADHVDLWALGRYDVQVRVADIDDRFTVMSAALAFTRDVRISQTGPHSEQFYGLQQLARGRRLQRDGQHDKAIAAAGYGLHHLLGDRWRPRTAPDDATLADMEAAKKLHDVGDLEAAAERYLQVFHARLLGYAERHHHPNLESARTDLEMAKDLVTGGDAELAFKRACWGIEALGGDYCPDQVLDDTGLKLLAAEDLERKGQTANAATTTIRVLDNRIGLYEQRWTDSL